MFAFLKSGYTHSLFHESVLQFLAHHFLAFWWDVTETGTLLNFQLTDIMLHFTSYRGLVDGPMDMFLLKIVDDIKVDFI